MEPNSALTLEGEELEMMSLMVVTKAMLLGDTWRASQTLAAIHAMH